MSLSEFLRRVRTLMSSAADAQLLANVETQVGHARADLEEQRRKLAWIRQQLMGDVQPLVALVEWSREQVDTFNTIKRSSIYIGGTMATVRAESPEDAIETLLHTLDK